jgi:hypothetical protein
MKEIQITQFEAFDGERFSTKKKCREYENDQLHKRLAGLTPDQVKTALDLADPDLAAAFERAALVIQTRRRNKATLATPVKPHAPSEITTEPVADANAEA